ncbi:uncharacterized protein METZ01_LOCUS321325 [marine metagenome]|uniref:Uncharacterized protein n=1 Tax=marine metagenome TaxID=408172 RepID=A0A382P9E9_9ZZZZ
MAETPATSLELRLRPLRSFSQLKVRPRREQQFNRLNIGQPVCCDVHETPWLELTCN